MEFDDLKPLPSWDTEGIATPEKGLKSFETLQKRAPGNVGFVEGQHT